MWFPLVVIAQFANAFATVLDKFLLSKRFKFASVLTFWTAVFNLLGLVFVFWDFSWQPSNLAIVYSLVSGVLFAIALQIFYVAMKTGEASHISPLTGGVIPVVSIFASYYLLGEQLSFYQIVGVILLVVGVLIISFEKSKKHSGWHIGMLWAAIAGVFFALNYVFARAAYMETTFSTAFVLARVGCFIPVMFLLLMPKVRGEIFTKNKKEKQKEKSSLWILVINKTLAALYFVGMQFSVSIASATLVNAVAGLQYAILIILVFILSKFFPKFFNEKFTKLEIAQEIFAILLIIGGLAVMVL
jgi:drug/metabolite transporter (DMT)-like permease